MDEDSIKYLSEFTGEDPEKIRNLTPTQLQKAKDRPSLLKGILDGNVEVSNDGTVRNTYKYKNSSTYKRIQALDDNSMIPSDLIAEMLNPLVRYSMEKTGKIPKVDYIPDIPMGSNGISKESLLLYMDRVNDGLVNDDMAHYTLDLEAKKDTKVSSLLGSNLKLNFLQKIDHEATVKNFSNLINRVSFDNPKKGDELLINERGETINASPVTEAYFSGTEIAPDVQKDIDSMVSSSYQNKKSGMLTQDEVLSSIANKYGFTNQAKQMMIPDNVRKYIYKSMYERGYAKDMAITQDPNSGNQALIFKTPLTYSVEGDVISVKTSTGKSRTYNKKEASAALRAKAERNSVLSRAKGFKGNADIITGPLYGFGFEE